MEPSRLQSVGCSADMSSSFAFPLSPQSYERMWHMCLQHSLKSRNLNPRDCAIGFTPWSHWDLYSSIFCLITLLGMSFIAKSKEVSNIFLRIEYNIFRLVAHKVSIVTTQCLPYQVAEKTAVILSKTIEYSSGINTLPKSMGSLYLISKDFHVLWNTILLWIFQLKNVKLIALCYCIKTDTWLALSPGLQFAGPTGISRKCWMAAN